MDQTMQTRNKTGFRRVFSTWVALAIVVAFASSSWADEKEISRLRVLIGEKGARWVAGETNVSRLPHADKVRLLGFRAPFLVQSHRLSASPFSSSSPLQAVALPTQFDWRNYGGNFVTPVRNQGNCGSCWAFAATAALESNVLISRYTPGVNLNLSEQVLLSCSGAGDCEQGGSVDEASDYIEYYGLPAESCFPYTAADLACGGACGSYLTDTYKTLNWHYVATWTAPTVTTLKTQLYNYGPLITTFSVYGDFYNYHSGIYKYVSGSYLGGHAVLLVGYDDQNQCFIVKNSWGSGWGEAGYFRIAYSELTNKVKFGLFTIAYEGTGSGPALPCSYSVSPASATLTYAGGYKTVNVTAGSNCAWTAKSDVSWIRVRSGAGGTANGSVRYYVERFNTSGYRIGTITIAGKTHTVTQNGRP